MRAIVAVVHQIVAHPIASSLISLILFVAALAETVSTLESDLGNGALRAHHGMLIFAGVQLLGGVAEVLEGLLELTESEHSEE